MPSLSFLRKRKRKKEREREREKARNGIERWIIERSMDTFEYTSPSRGDDTRREEGVEVDGRNGSHCSTGI